MSTNSTAAKTRNRGRLIPSLLKALQAPIGQESITNMAVGVYRRYPDHRHRYRRRLISTLPQPSHTRSERKHMPGHIKLHLLRILHTPIMEDRISATRQCHLHQIKVALERVCLLNSNSSSLYSHISLIT